MEFKDNLKQARLASGLMQKELADKMGIYQKDISRWENGERSPSIMKLRDLCIALNVSADELLEINIK